MPTALWIAHVHVTDAEAYGRYAKGATEATGVDEATWARDRRVELTWE